MQCCCKPLGLIQCMKFWCQWNLLHRAFDRDCTPKERFGRIPQGKQNFKRQLVWAPCKVFRCFQHVLIAEHPKTLKGQVNWFWLVFAFGFMCWLCWLFHVFVRVSQTSPVSLAVRFTGAQATFRRVFRPSHEAEKKWCPKGQAKSRAGKRTD